jgi:hypothetical protein
MKDRLKNFIEEHRDEFEIYQPREILWNGIQERLHEGGRRILWQKLAIAVSVLLLITCGTWIFIASRRNNEVAQSPGSTTPSILGAEVYFTRMVQIKDAELEQYCRPQPVLCREFENDISSLNEAYMQLKKEYITSADKKTILQAMMNNLQMQLDVMNRQLEVMQTVKKKKETIVI